MINGYGFPIIISDRAISQSGSEQSIILPSTNNKTLIPTPVIDFNVKTIIIQDILCVGFARIVYDVKKMLAEIEDFFCHRTVGSDPL